MIKAIVFDLDGTLVKSHETIYRATIATLKRLNIPTDFDINKFYSLLGHHFQDIFNGCGINVPDLDKFITIYKKDYYEYLDYSKLYPNAISTLEKLKANNFKLALLTTKLHDQALPLVKHFKLDVYLDIVQGRVNGVPHKPDPEQYLNICNEFNVDPQTTMMVGDTELDILCAKNANAKSCGVKFGYRTIEELKQFNPDYMIENLSELLNLVGIN